MEQKYYTIRIIVANEEDVQLEIRNSENRLVGEPRGRFGLNGENRSRALALHENARNGILGSEGIDELGGLLFSALFDDTLSRELINTLQHSLAEACLLRLELDIDEIYFPWAASLPWEFMCMPSESDHGSIRIGTDPNIVFARRRKLLRMPEPIVLDIGEPLRIVVAVAAPEDLGAVQYEKIWTELKEQSRRERFEIMDIVNPADRIAIDEALEKRPHIFHFIGHGRFKDENLQDSGQLALVDNFGRTDWVSANYFGGLFNRHKPGLVLLQTCESGSLSSSKAFVGVASQLVQENIPAVAAMQFEVSNAAAQRFALEFYRRLANNEPVDRACQEARRRIALGPNGYESRDFATPVLFMRVREGRLFQRPTDIPDQEELMAKMVEDALQIEQNGSFDKAIKTWKDIRDIEPEYPKIDSILKRLEEKIENQGSIQKLLEGLTYRKEELKILFFQVVKKLKRMAKKGVNEEDRVDLDVIRDFLAGNLSCNEFADYWEKSVTRYHQERGPNYNILAQRLKRGEIVPFLGAEVLHLCRFPVPAIRDVVKEMADRVDYPDFNGTLPMISQYYQMEGFSRGMLIGTVRELMERERENCESNSLCSLLADINTPMVVISMSYDDLLEHRFREKGKKFVVILHHINSLSESDFGKILLKYSDKAEQETPCAAEELSGLKLLENGYSVIYKICGCFSLFDREGQETVETHRELDPLMILENDFFAFSRHLEKLLPQYILRQFQGRGFLFMGYGLEEWKDRLIAHAILEKGARATDSSFAIWKNPNKFEKAFWKSNHVDILDVELPQFVNMLSDSISRVNHGV